MALTWLPGTIENVRTWTDGLFTLSIRVRDVAQFQPGQFLQLAMKQDDRHVFRPYSVASPHGEVLEFFIVRVDDGELTPRLWELKVGDSIDVGQKAAGGFTLQKSPDASALWLVATGTGIAPYIAMLRTEEPWQRYENIVVVHGVRNSSDLAYVDEMDSYKNKAKGRFAYVPVVSRTFLDEHAELKKIGLAGRITDVTRNGKLVEVAGVEMPHDDSCVMLCGNPQMLDEMESILMERGMKRHKHKEPGQIIVERYW